ncbi:MAG TPA: hypothetical protein VMV77_02060 [Bacteroidales bacterium]|nr:hypothetical protein [Bacteroidales bacterium]
MKTLLSSFLLILINLPIFGQKDAILFNRFDEPKKKAFSLLVPRGWILEGGAIRLLDPNIAGVSNMVDCKFDLTVKKDTEGSVMIRWLPEMLCINQSQAWGNPEGAIFNNTLVRRKRDPVSFILQVAIPYAHPNSLNVKVVSSKPVPELAALYAGMIDPSVKKFLNMSYQAVIVEFTYEENGKGYTERMVTVIEDYGMNGGGLWKNRQTMLVRTPVGQMSKWEPVLQVIQNSGIWNINWIAGEVNGQRKRAGQIAATQRELQEMDNAINENRRNTHSEINKDMYLTLTGQNEYTNPFTGKPEIDTDNWKNRWITPEGNILYTNDPEYDPNIDPDMHITGFIKSIPRK